MGRESPSPQRTSREQSPGPQHSRDHDLWPLPSLGYHSSLPGFGSQIQALCSPPTCDTSLTFVLSQVFTGWGERLSSDMASAFYPSPFKKSLSQETQRVLSVGGRQPDLTEKENQASEATVTRSRSHDQGIVKPVLSPALWVPELALSILSSCRRPKSPHQVGRSPWVSHITFLKLSFSNSKNAAITALPTCSKGCFFIFFS